MKKTFFQKKVLFFMAITLITWMSVLPGAYGSKLTSTAPTIDGNASEWALINSTRITVNGGYIHLMNDSTNLYVLIDITSDTYDDPPSTPRHGGDDDFFVLPFDVDRNHSITPNTDLAFYTTDITLSPCFMFFVNNNPIQYGSCLPAPGYLVSRGFGASVNSATPHRIWELQIPRSMIGTVSFNSPISFTVRLDSKTPYLIAQTPSNYLDFSNALPDQLDQPVAYYPFDGNVNDASGNGYDGTPSGGVSYTADRIGNPNSAVSFDGSSGSITTPALNFAGSQGVSVSLWLKANVVQPGVPRSYYLVVDSSGASGAFGVIHSFYPYPTAGLNQIAFAVYGTTIGSAGGYIDPGSWFHFVGTYDGTTVKAYINGSLIQQTGFNGPMNDPNSPLNFGGLSPYPYYWNGFLDDVRIYNGVLTSSEILQLYNQPPTCRYEIAPTSANIPASGGTGYSFNVSAGTGCAWTAASNNPDWIIITGGASGSGNGSVTYDVLADIGGSGRSGTMTIAGQTLTVSQASGAMIDPTVWADLEVFRRINGGVLESEIRRQGSNGNNYLLFYNPSTVNSFQADLTVKDWQNNNSYPYASLFGRVYRGVYKTIMGDVIGHVGIGHNGTQLEGFWSISRCTTANCNLPSEYEQICSGLVDNAFIPSLNTTYTLSFSWDGFSTFTFGIDDKEHPKYTRVISSLNCSNLPANDGSPEVNSRGIGTRVSQINGPNEGGYIAATFDNVKVDGSSYDTFDSPPIDRTNWWGSLELVSMVDNGELLSELTQRGVNGGYNMSFVNSQAILGFEADLKVLEFQYNPALSVRPHGRLYAALYNDGTPGSGLIGDVIANVGILDNGQGLGPQAFYAVSHCLAPNCNLSTEYEILTSGIFLVTVGLNQTHRFSLSWDGFNVALGCDGNVIFYNPTSVVSVGGPPRFRKGIGTRVTEINDPSEWAYVSAAFDNVVVTSMGYPLTVTKSGTGTGTVTSTPAGINCGSDCGGGYPSGTVVTLTATPGIDSTFSGWSGACSGDPCTITMDAVKSVTASFQIVPPPQPPPPPVLYLPSTGEPGVSLTPTLSWYASAGATSYGVQVSKYDSFSILDIDQSGITATSYGIPSGKLSGNTKYYWRVNATNVGGTSAWSSPYFYFYTTVAAPAIPTLASPANGATGVSITPTLSWNASTGAGYYGLQVATDPGFTSIVVSQIISVPTISYPMPAGKLLNGTTYYWRVYAADIDLGASDWSDIWHFTTVSAPAGPPAPPTLVSPNNGQTQVPTNPTLTWNASTGATSYQLQVSIDPSFQTGTTVFYPSGTSQPISGLSNNTTYYWRVTDNSIPDNWSAIWSFITEASFGVPFIGAGGMLDPDWDKEVDGIDDTFEQNTIYTDPTKKTIFIRPKIEIRAPDPSTGFAGEYQRWADFKDIYFPNSPAGRANIPPFTNANVEIVVIGDLTNPYPPMQDINYAPAADSNFTANSHYGADIIDIIFKPNAYCTSANVNFGHPSFDSSYAAGPRWVWDTKGFTSPGGRYGYGTVEIYGLPHENYFNEGAYTSIAVGQGPITTSGGPPTCNSGKCYNFGNESPMNLSGAVPPSGRPDTTVEFNTISFNKNSTPPGAITSVGAKGKEYYREHVYRRTIAHELGHALGMAHCSNPACIMNGDSIDWDMKNFGTGGNCTHDPSVLIHNGPATPRAPLLVSPAKGAQIANPNPNPITLTWNRFTSSGATSYQLQVSGANSSNFSTKLADVTLSGSATSYAVTIPKRASYANYYWQVRGCSVIGGTTSCGPWQPSTPTPQFFKTN